MRCQKGLGANPLEMLPVIAVPAVLAGGICVGLAVKWGRKPGFVITGACAALGVFGALFAAMSEAWAPSVVGVVLAVIFCSAALGGGIGTGIGARFGPDQD